MAARAAAKLVRKHSLRADLVKWGIRLRGLLRYRDGLLARKFLTVLDATADGGPQIVVPPAPTFGGHAVG